MATESAEQQRQGTEGLGRAGQATWEKPKTDPSIAEDPVTELHPGGFPWLPDASMDPLLRNNLFGRGDRSAATGSH